MHKYMLHAHTKEQEEFRCGLKEASHGAVENCRSAG